LLEYKGNRLKMNIRKLGWGDMIRIHVIQDGDQWRALVNTVMNFRVPEYVGKFLSN
jgi:hypothetical protein